MRESASRPTPRLGGGTTITGVTRIYGGFVSSDSITRMEVRQDDINGKVIFLVPAPVAIAGGAVMAPFPVVTEGKTLYIGFPPAADVSHGGLFVNHYEVITAPGTSLICRVSVVVQGNTNLLSRVTVVSA